MKINIFTLQARLKAIQAFLEHYFQDSIGWKENISKSFELKIIDNYKWNIVVYDDLNIFKTWSFEEIENYLDQNFIYV